jgi:TNF receptor-associated protein 1
VDSPAIVVEHESASFRRMMKYVDPSRAPTLPKQIMEVNPSHPIIKKLHEIRGTKPSLATLVLQQVYSNDIQLQIYLFCL